MNRENKDRIILITIIFLIVLVIAHRMFFSIMINNIHELKAEIKSIDKKISEAKQKNNDLSSLAKEFDDIQSRVNKLNQNIYNKDELKLIKNIWSSASKIGFNILEIKPENKKNESELSTDNYYYIVFNGSFNSFYNFIRYCNTLPANLKIVKIIVNGSENGSIGGKLWFFIRKFKENNND